jgi:hypothetical protein
MIAAIALVLVLVIGGGILTTSLFTHRILSLQNRSGGSGLNLPAPELLSGCQVPRWLLRDCVPGTEGMYPPHPERPIVRGWLFWP